MENRYQITFDYAPGSTGVSAQLRVWERKQLFDSSGEPVAIDEAKRGRAVGPGDYPDDFDGLQAHCRGMLEQALGVDDPIAAAGSTIVRLCAERDGAISDRDTIAAERDALQAERNALAIELTGLQGSA